MPWWFCFLAAFKQFLRVGQRFAQAPRSLTQNGKNVSVQPMNKFIFRRLGSFLALTGALFLVASCKPKEQTDNTSPASPPVISATATNEAATNEAVTNASPVDPSAISPEEARNHVGQMATVRGKVDRVHVSQKGDVFIDMGGKHPNAAFTAVCFKQAIPTEQLERLSGKIISVKGKIREYNGKVEIILEKPEQIVQ